MSKFAISQDVIYTPVQVNISSNWDMLNELSPKRVGDGVGSDAVKSHLSVAVLYILCVLCIIILAALVLFACCRTRRQNLTNQAAELKINFDRLFAEQQKVDAEVNSSDSSFSTLVDELKAALDGVTITQITANVDTLDGLNKFLDQENENFGEAKKKIDKIAEDYQTKATNLLKGMQTNFKKCEAELVEILTSDLAANAFQDNLSEIKAELQRKNNELKLQIQGIETSIKNNRSSLVGNCNNRVKAVFTQNIELIIKSVLNSVNVEATSKSIAEKDEERKKITTVENEFTALKDEISKTFEEELTACVSSVRPTKAMVETEKNFANLIKFDEDVAETEKRLETLEHSVKAKLQKLNEKRVEVEEKRQEHKNAVDNLKLAEVKNYADGCQNKIDEFIQANDIKLHDDVPLFSLKVMINEINEFEAKDKRYYAPQTLLDCENEINQIQANLLQKIEQAKKEIVETKRDISKIFRKTLQDQEHGYMAQLANKQSAIDEKIQLSSILVNALKADLDEVTITQITANVDTLDGLNKFLDQENENFGEAKKKIDKIAEDYQTKATNLLKDMQTNLEKCEAELANILTSGLAANAFPDDLSEVKTKLQRKNNELKLQIQGIETSIKNNRSNLVEDYNNRVKAVFTQNIELIIKSVLNSVNVEATSKSIAEKNEKREKITTAENEFIALKDEFDKMLEEITTRASDIKSNEDVIKTEEKLETLEHSVKAKLQKLNEKRVEVEEKRQEHKEAVENLKLAEAKSYADGCKKKIDEFIRDNGIEFNDGVLLTNLKERVDKIKEFWAEDETLSEPQTLLDCDNEINQIQMNLSQKMEQAKTEIAEAKKGIEEKEIEYLETLIVEANLNAHVLDECKLACENFFTRLNQNVCEYNKNMDELKKAIDSAQSSDIQIWLDSASKIRDFEFALKNGIDCNGVLFKTRLWQEKLKKLQTQCKCIDEKLNILKNLHQQLGNKNFDEREQKLDEKCEKLKSSLKTLEIALETKQLVDKFKSATKSSHFSIWLHLNTSPYTAPYDLLKQTVLQKKSQIKDEYVKNYNYKLHKKIAGTVPCGTKPNYFYRLWDLKRDLNVKTDCNYSKKTLMLSEVRMPTIAYFKDAEVILDNQDEPDSLSSLPKNMYAPFLYNMYGEPFGGDEFREITTVYDEKARKCFETMPLQIKDDAVFWRDYIMGSSGRMVNWLAVSSSGAPPHISDGILQEIMFTQACCTDPLFNWVSYEQYNEKFQKGIKNASLNSSGKCVIYRSLNEPNAYIYGTGTHFTSFRLDDEKGVIYTFDSYNSYIFRHEICKLILPITQVVSVEVERQEGCSCSMHATANAIYSYEIVEEYKAGRRAGKVSHLCEPNSTREIPQDLWDEYKNLQRENQEWENEVAYCADLGDVFTRSLCKFTDDTLSDLGIFKEILKATESDEQFNEFIKCSNSKEMRKCFDNFCKAIINFDYGLQGSYLVEGSEKIGIERQGLNSDIISHLLLKYLVLYPQEIISHYSKIKEKLKQFSENQRAFIEKICANENIEDNVKEKYKNMVIAEMVNAGKIEAMKKRGENLGNSDEIWFRHFTSVENYINTIKSVYEKSSSFELNNSTLDPELIKSLLMVLCPQDAITVPQNIDWQSDPIKRLSLSAFLGKYAVNTLEKMPQEIEDLKNLSSLKKFIVCDKKLKEHLKKSNEKFKEILETLGNLENQMNAPPSMPILAIEKVEQQIENFKMVCDTYKSETYNLFDIRSAKIKNQTTNEQKEIKNYVRCKLGKIGKNVDEVKQKAEFLKMNFPESEQYFSNLDTQCEKIKEKIGQSSIDEIAATMTKNINGEDFEEIISNLKGKMVDREVKPIYERISNLEQFLNDCKSKLSKNIKNCHKTLSTPKNRSASITPSNKFKTLPINRSHSVTSEFKSHSPLVAPKL